MLSTKEHSRDRVGFKYIYPVISRRSGGLSIGVNLNTNNACNWRCIYCQVPNLTRGSAPPVNLKKLQEELILFLDDVLYGDFYETEEIPLKLRQIKDIAISGNGEPTTADEFGEVIEIINSVLNKLALTKKIKCVLITNGSLVSRDYVKQGLTSLALLNGEVWFKIDSARPEGIELINQISGTELSVLKRLVISTSHCTTYIQTCVFNFKGKAPSNLEITAYIDLIKKIVGKKIPVKGVLLYGVERPSLLPEAENKITKLSEEWLYDFADKIRNAGLEVKVSI